MKLNDLKKILKVFLTLQWAKELPRQGFIAMGFKRNEADIGETIVGDVGTFVKGMAGGVFKNIEEEGVAALVDGLDSEKEIIDLVEEYNQRNTLEARVVKAADNLDALAQAKGVPGAQDALKYFKQVYHITKFDWHKKAVDLILSGEIEPARDW